MHKILKSGSQWKSQSTSYGIFLQGLKKQADHKYYQKLPTQANSTHEGTFSQETLIQLETVWSHMEYTENKIG